MFRWFFVLSLLLATPANAARIWSTTEPIGSTGVTLNVIYIEGDIVAGDAEIFRAVAKRFVGRGAEVRLDSPGGALDQALEIGDMVRAVFFGTLVEDGAVCASACVFIQSAGVIRMLGETARIGLHRPKFPTAAFANLTPQQAREKYDNMLAIVRDYWARIGGAPEVFRIMTSTPSTEIHWIGGGAEADALGIQGRDPAYAEWVLARKAAAHAAR